MKRHDELLKKYMELPYTMNIIPDKEEGGYTVYFPDLPGCATCVESLDEVKEMAEDAKREWLKTALEDGVEIKTLKSLHQQLSYRASEEGVSLNQYIVYELGRAMGQ